MVVEIAGMKGINDYYTQTGGDALLRAAAKVIQDAARIEDIVARVRSDRFAVLARGISNEDAATLAANIKDGIGRLDVLLQTGDFSMRIEGVDSHVAVVPLSEVVAPATPEAFMRAANARLEQVKKGDFPHE
jgi:diguanylate cyclase (GGDEF)-like protein